MAVAPVPDQRHADSSLEPMGETLKRLAKAEAAHELDVRLGRAGGPTPERLAKGDLREQPVIVEGQVRRQTVHIAGRRSRYLRVWVGAELYPFIERYETLAERAGLDHLAGWRLGSTGGRANPGDCPPNEQILRWRGMLRQKRAACTDRHLRALDFLLFGCPITKEPMTIEEVAARMFGAALGRDLGVEQVKFHLRKAAEEMRLAFQG